jgi:hypothetical protein
MDKATKEAEALLDAVTDGAYVQLAGRKHSRQAKRRVWSCALLTRPLWLYCSLADLKRLAVDLAGLPRVKAELAHQWKITAS